MEANLLLTIFTAYRAPDRLSVHTLQVEKLPVPRILSPRLYCWRKEEFCGRKAEQLLLPLADWSGERYLKDRALSYTIVGQGCK